MKELIFDLPKPISTNDLFRNVAKVGRVKTTNYKHWLEEAGWIINTAKRGQEMYFGPVSVVIYLSDKWRGDGDNCVKSIFDAIEAAGVIKNDRQVIEHSVKRANIKGVRVIVRAAESEAE